MAAHLCRCRREQRFLAPTRFLLWRAVALNPYRAASTGLRTIAETAPRQKAGRLLEYRLLDTVRRVPSLSLQQ